MFPIEQGAGEMLLLAALALVVLGPKDLPVVMRRIGQFVAKMRGMAAEFRASFDELGRQAELDALRKEVEAMRTGNFGEAATPAPNQAQTHDLTPDLTPSYNPFEDTGSGLDHAGFAFPPEPAMPAPAKPARKPRAKKAAVVAEAEPAPAPAPSPAKPARKRRAASAGQADVG